jgi:hypothetical protein
MDKQITKSIKFRIKKLELVEHSLFTSKIPSNIKQHDLFYFNTTVGLNFNFKDEYLIINVVSRFAYDEHKEIELGFINTLTTFAIEKLNSFVEKKEPQKVLVNIPDFLMANFIGLAISSARGMLATLTKGTPLESAILPIQDPMLFAQKLALRTEKIKGESPTQQIK